MAYSYDKLNIDNILISKVLSNEKDLKDAMARMFSLEVHNKGLDHAVDTYKENIESSKIIINEEINTLRGLIRNYVSNSKEKIVVDGVGSVSKKEYSDKWVILDEAILIGELNHLLSQEEMEQVLPMVQKLSKRDLYSVLDKLERENLLPSSVEKIKEEDGVMIKYEKGFFTTNKIEIKDVKEVDLEI